MTPEPTLQDETANNSDDSPADGIQGDHADQQQCEHHQRGAALTVAVSPCNHNSGNADQKCRAHKPSTVESYRITVEHHLIPTLGAHALTDLEARPDLVDGLVAKAVGAGLAAKTVTNIVLVLRVMLKQAVRRRLLRTNPAAGGRAAPAGAARDAGAYGCEIAQLDGVRGAGGRGRPEVPALVGGCPAAGVRCPGDRSAPGRTTRAQVA
jgi:hypothetical protein